MSYANKWPDSLHASKHVSNSYPFKIFDPIVVDPNAKPAPWSKLIRHTSKTSCARVPLLSSSFQFNSHDESLACTL
ncbi:hypothetical protein IAQ61_009634 [Plenodomus lingam]|uniref:uncharacterized protein n=1 Tax=Leptosphaeria maculans TaxID=5022 RepID=UPI0033267B95|nr:hypothetical protein IAQ61_009634 [Plenodomus lingam]